jgi:DNA polymerase-3 subunit epsilon
MEKLLFLDTEATGLNPERNGIIQLSAIMDINGEAVEEFDERVKPWDACEFTKEAQDVTGKTREQIAEFTPERVAYSGFTSFLSRHISPYDKLDKAFIVGYNASFDNSMIRALAARCGDKYFGSFVWSPFLDVMTLAGMKLKVKRSQMVNFKLESVAREILGAKEVESLKFHDSLEDIRVTRKIYLELIK